MISVTEHAKQSLPHRRTRHDHSTELAEDYVEAIAEISSSDRNCRIVDLAKYFGVSHVTVNRMVGRLQNEGLVSTEPYKPVRLTAKRQSPRKSLQRARNRLSILVGNRSGSPSGRD